MEPADPFLDGGATVKIHGEVVMDVGFFLIMLVVIIFLLYCCDQCCLPSPSPHIAFDAPDLSPAAPHCGLNSAVLRSLPVSVYRVAGSEDGRLECAICLSELDDGDEARVLPKCGHGFHLECIDMWFDAHSTCPLCRFAVAAEASSEWNPAAEATETPPPSETAPESPITDVAGALVIEIPRSELEWLPILYM